jgi:dolichol-phosphate mannosyltransferase
VTTAPSANLRRRMSLCPCPKGPLVVAALADPAIRLSLVVPTYDEAESLPPLLAELTRLLDAELPGAYEIIVVDDDSPDESWAVAEELAAGQPQLRVIRRTGERGLATAVIRGWQLARGDVVGVIDADLQHPPDAIIKLWAEMARGADLAIASRNVAGGGVSDWSLLRRVLSRSAQLLALVILPGVVSKLSDPMSGFFLVRRAALAGVALDPLGYKILLEVAARSRVAWVGEVGYVFREREHGASKVSAGVYVDYLRHLVRLRLGSLPLARFFRFALVGVSGVVVDMTMLYLLSDPKTLGWGLTRSKVVAAELALINNFLWNDAWTFRDMVGEGHGLRHKLHRFVKFNAICGIGIVLNVVLLNLQFNLLNMNRYLANAVAIAIVTLWNFLLNMKLSWRDTEAN